MSGLVRDGKVRFLGIAEAGPRTIGRTHATHPMSDLTRALHIAMNAEEREAAHRLRMQFMRNV